MQDDPTTLRLSLDAKAVVLIGDYSRGGKSRLVVKALDHDFRPTDKVTPYGSLLPDHDRLYLYFTCGPVTSDFIVDCLQNCWRQIHTDFPLVQTLVLLQDNGPENHSRRTQFMHRMVEFSDAFQLNIRLNYYPPYHSKYNPVVAMYRSTICSSMEIRERRQKFKRTDRLVVRLSLSCIMQAARRFVRAALSMAGTNPALAT